MTLLLWLTLAYLAILVLALAGGLTLVWLRLRAIDRGLAAAHSSLLQVAEASAPLEEEIAPLRDRLMAAIEALETAAEDLTGAGERVRERSDVAAAGGV